MYLGSNFPAHVSQAYLIPSEGALCVIQVTRIRLCIPDSICEDVLANNVSGLRIYGELENTSYSAIVVVNIKMTDISTANIISTP